MWKYRILAALFDLSIFKHFLMAIIQIIIAQLIGKYIVELNYSVVVSNNYLALNIFQSVFTIILAAVIV